MRRVFSNFELVAEDEISHGLTGLVSATGLPVIALDRVYFHSSLNLEIARLVDRNGQDRGHGHRVGTPLLLPQTRRLRETNIHEVAIVDDVVFSGALLERIIGLLSSIGIRAPIVCAGIGIAEGVNRLNRRKCEVRCVRIYKEVVDEVCERDFYPGVPLSGRLLVGDDNVGVPYLYPFGNPERWASIPAEYAAQFSVFCIHQTILLFDEIERCSRKFVFCQDLGRKVVGLPIGAMRYTDVLRNIIS